MCLIVDKRQDKPSLTSRHYLVWKRLLYPNHSPYRHFPYKFGIPYTLSPAQARRFTWPPTKMSIIHVSDGYHAFKTKRVGARWQSGRLEGVNTSWYPCIIPAGSLVWYGRDEFDDNDVTSNQIVVFRNMHEVKKWLADN